jgi:hypothetical protein
VFEAAGDFVEGVHFDQADHFAADPEVFGHLTAGPEFVERGLQGRHELRPGTERVLFGEAGQVGAAGRRLAPGMVR